MKKLASRSDCYQLLMIGDGDLKSEILQKVQVLGLTDRVKFMDACPNVNEYYNVFDCFCLPSLFEGLGLVGIEAQVNGLNCVVSDTVPKELDITGNICFLPIGNDNIDAWINVLLNISTKRNDAVVEKVSKNCYDICTSAKKLQALYTEALEV
jgi:glycosyltransferase involved in cell wall biosynthesis